MGGSRESALAGAGEAGDGVEAASSLRGVSARLSSSAFLGGVGYGFLLLGESSSASLSGSAASGSAPSI